MFRRMLARPISYNSLCSQVAQSTSSPSLSNWTKEALVSSRAKFLKDPRFLSNDNRTFTVFFEINPLPTFSRLISLSLLIHVRISNRGKKCYLVHAIGSKLIIRRSKLPRRAFFFFSKILLNCFVSREYVIDIYSPTFSRSTSILRVRIEIREIVFPIPREARDTFPPPGKFS